MYANKKIVIVASYPESILRFRGELIGTLKDQCSYDIHLVAPFSSHRDVRETLLNLGYFCHSIRLQRTGTNPLLDILVLLQLFILFFRLRPELVLAYTIKPVVYGMIAARLAGVQKRVSLITGLGYAFSNEDNKGTITQRLAQFLYKISMRLSNLVFFQNPDDQKLFKDLAILPINVSSYVVNGSGVNLDYYQYKKISESRECVKFLMIARIIPDKGIREYVAAAKSIKKVFPDMIFSLVGWIDGDASGISQQELDAWISEGIIDYKGKLSDVREVIADHDVYVLPSYREGTPRTVLEAMAVGRAIITTDAPGCRETVVDGLNGFVVRTKDEDELATAMLRFCNDFTLADSMGKASRLLVENRYDVYKVNQFMLDKMDIK